MAGLHDVPNHDYFFKRSSLYEQTKQTLKDHWDQSMSEVQKQYVRTACHQNQVLLKSKIEQTVWMDITSESSVHQDTSSTSLVLPGAYTEVEKDQKIQDVGQYFEALASNEYLSDPDAFISLRPRRLLLLANNVLVNIVERIGILVGALWRDCFSAIRLCLQMHFLVILI